MESANVTQRWEGNDQLVVEPLQAGCEIYMMHFKDKHRNYNLYKYLMQKKMKEDYR